MKPKFFGKVENGKIIFNDKESFEDYYRKFESKEIELTIDRKRKSRSNDQNRYYWGIVVQLLCNHTGYTPDEMHDALRIKFLSVNKELPTLKSTTTLSTIEFETYMSDVREWASMDFGIYIPEPNEVEF